MEAEINADFPIQMNSAGDLLSDLVDFEDKMSQMLIEVQSLEDEHEIDIEFKTKTKGDDEVLEITLTDSKSN
jgi:hypothetical protein